MYVDLITLLLQPGWLLVIKLYEELLQHLLVCKVQIREVSYITP